MLAQGLMVVRPLIPSARWLFEMNQTHISRDRYQEHEVALVESFSDRILYKEDGKREYGERV